MLFDYRHYFSLYRDYLNDHINATKQCILGNICEETEMDEYVSRIDEVTLPFIAECSKSMH